MANPFYPSSTKAAPMRFTGSALDRATSTGLAGSSFARPASQRPPSMPSMPVMPSAPGGRLVPGRGAGSMVWQPDAATPVPMPGAAQSPSNPASPANPSAGGLQGTNPLTGEWLNSNGGGGRSPLDAPGLPPLEFGGAFANGGIAPPGKVSLVGERGPELIMPSGPTQVMPLESSFRMPTQAVPNAGNRGRLVQTSSGGVTWQREEGTPDPLATAPPQSGGGYRPMDAAFQPSSSSPALPRKAAPFNDTGSSMDRHMSTGLAGSPRRQVGRSANDPMRIAERMRRQGDPSAILRFGQQQMGQDFARQMNDVNFNQSMQMRGLDQAFTASRDAQQRQDALDAEGRQNARRDAEWQRNRDAEMQARQNQGIDSAFTMTSPDGQFFVPMVKDKGGNARPMGGAFPVPKPGATPEQIQGMQDDASKKGYDLIQMPNGEWKLNKRDAPQSGGWETTTTDAQGNTTRSVRKPIGAGGSPGSRTSGTGIF